MANLKRKVEALSLVVKVSNIIGYLPIGLEEILTTVTTEASAFLAPAACHMLLRDEPALGEPPFELSRCRVFRQGLPVVAFDVGEDGCSCSRACGTTARAYACLPIVAGQEVLGALVVESPQAGAISRDDLEVLLSLANQTSLALQRAELFRRLEEEKAQLEQANRELKDAQQQIIHTEKMAAAGRLAADLAHEINNPTGVILTRLDCLLGEAQEEGYPPALVRDLEVIQRHGRRIAQSTASLLSFARLPKGQVESLVINALLEETLSFLDYRLTRQGVRVELRLAPALPTVRGDGPRLQQVWFNLLENARDAMPEGGTITVESRRDEEGWVAVTMADTGTGIRPEHLKRIFDPFFTTKAAGRGTGLGLAISLTIVREMGGTMGVESVLGKGAAFTVRLPPEV